MSVRYYLLILVFVSGFVAKSEPFTYKDDNIAITFPSRWSRVLQKNSDSIVFSEPDGKSWVIVLVLSYLSKEPVKEVFFMRELLDRIKCSVQGEINPDNRIVQGPLKVIKDGFSADWFGINKRQEPFEARLIICEGRVITVELIGIKRSAQEIAELKKTIFPTIRFV